MNLEVGLVRSTRKPLTVNPCSTLIELNRTLGRRPIIEPYRTLEVSLRPLKGSLLWNLWYLYKGKP